MIAMLHKRSKGYICRAHHKFKKEEKHISLDCSMDAVVELGYQIEEEEKKRTILHLIIQRISEMLSNHRLKEKRKVYHGDKL